LLKIIYTGSYNIDSDECEEGEKGIMTSWQGISAKKLTMV